MMFAFKTKAALAASALALSALSIPAAAQVSGGTSGGVRGQDVDASTCGYGSADGNGTTVGGCADAEARNGGTAETRTDARSNDRRAMQRSVAKARDDDERARSRTRTVVRNRRNGEEVVRSRTSTMYRMKGERPVRESISTRTTPQGTTTRTGKKNRKDD